MDTKAQDQSNSFTRIPIPGTLFSALESACKKVQFGPSVNQFVAELWRRSCRSWIIAIKDPTIYTKKQRTIKFLNLPVDLVETMKEAQLEFKEEGLHVQLSEILFAHIVAWCAGEDSDWDEAVGMTNLGFRGNSAGTTRAHYVSLFDDGPYHQNIVGESLNYGTKFLWTWEQV